MTIKEFFESKAILAIHCDTEEKAKKLLKVFDKLGHCWASGDSYIKYTDWKIYKDETCYTNDGCYGDVECFRKENNTILEFDEIEFEDASLKSCIEKIQSITDKEEKRPQSTKEEKKAIEETFQKCAEFFGITSCICTYTYSYGNKKITLYTDKPNPWIGYHGNGVKILNAALSAALHKDDIQVAIVELKGFMSGSIQIGEWYKTDDKENNK